jgi:hypothetical protein
MEIRDGKIVAGLTNKELEHGILITAWRPTKQQAVESKSLRAAEEIIKMLTDKEVDMSSIQDLIKIEQIIEDYYGET